MLRNCVLEGSPDNSTWTILREHVNDTKLDRPSVTATWSIPSRRCRCFRIRSTGLSSSRDNYVVVSGFEVYGEIVQ